jgi:hypothetical protein
VKKAAPKKRAARKLAARARKVAGKGRR